MWLFEQIIKKKSQQTKQNKNYKPKADRQQQTRYHERAGDQSEF